MIDLPDHPSPNGCDIGLMDFGATLTPPLGGPVQRINRLGSRFKISVSLPPMTEKAGRKWIVRLVQGKREGIRTELPLLGFEPGPVGTVRINGASQSGSSLIVDGATPNYAFREGQPFSIETGGKHHLYMVKTETIANATGQATLPITPPLRRPHLDNDLCHFAKPMIEGLIEGDEVMWNFALGNFVGLSFGIAESQ